jgi:prophage DNA circulation protein
MNTQASIVSINSETFGEWVTKVAAINEEFSEALRDTADIIATIDPDVASGLYKAADTASNTVHQLRQSIPKIAPTPVTIPIKDISKPLWFGLGILLGFMAHG